MQKKFFLIIVLFFWCAVFYTAEEDYLKIIASVHPQTIGQSEEGILKLKISPQNGIKISSHPEMVIKLDDNSNCTFPKSFFTASELDFPTRREEDAVFLDLGKAVNIMFKVNEDSLLGRQKISGEITFTAVLKDNWSVKTYQKFLVDFYSIRNQKFKVKKK